MDAPATSATAQGRTAGSGRGRRLGLVAAAATTVALGAGTLAAAGDGDATCATVRTVAVAVSPDLVPVVQQAAVHAEQDPAAEACVRLQVSAEQPAEVLRRAVGVPPARPDVWIPDSGLWVEQAAAAGVALPADRPPVARSLAVLALHPDLARSLSGAGQPAGFSAVLGALRGDTAQLELLDPARDAAAALGLRRLLDTAATLPDGRTALATVLRLRRPAPAGTTELLAAAASDSRVVAAVTEQAVVSHNRRAGRAELVAAYPGVPAASDYPYVVLSRGAADIRAADRLLAALSDDVGRRSITAAGFRGADGSALSEDSAGLGVQPAAGADRSPSAPDVRDAVQFMQAVTLGTRMLAVLDVSGSMGRSVPGAGGASRMAVTLNAASRGLALYPDDTEMGLWVFARDLPSGQDHEELVPLGPLGRRPDGRLGREMLARALREVRVVPDGDTGLYDTVLAAVRTVRDGWDPARVNSVVVITDGRNEDDGLDLPGLVGLLKRENDPTRPVPVVTIALGPDSDHSALRAFSEVTGGSSYVTDDAANIEQVFEEAMGRRSCQPAC